VVKTVADIDKTHPAPRPVVAFLIVYREGGKVRLSVTAPEMSPALGVSPPPP
jgi:hypothetical protein